MPCLAVEQATHARLHALPMPRPQHSPFARLARTSRVWPRPTPSERSARHSRCAPVDPLHSGRTEPSARAAPRAIATSASRGGTERQYLNDLAPLLRIDRGAAENIVEIMLVK